MKRSFIMGTALMLLLAIAVGSVEASETSFHASFAGTCINTDDFSFTGTPAHSCTVAGRSTQGPYTAQSVGEGPQDDQKTCLLPGGGSGVELVLVGDVFVLSFASKGDQLFLRLSPSVTSHACFGPTTGVFIGQTTFEVSSGTGRFAGAAGTIVETFTASVLAPPPSGKGFFANFTGTFDGKIKFAED
jgi:hypothetical protein